MYTIKCCTKSGSYLKYNFDGSTDQIYIDTAKPSFIGSLKLMLDEREDYENVIELYKSSSSKLWSIQKNT